MRGRTVLFGGMNGNTTSARLADTWEFDGFNWSQVATTGGPSARSNHVLACDVPRARTVLFGGVDRNNTELADTWEFDGVSWLQVAAAAGPSIRSAHASTWDWARRRLVVFGGGRYGHPVLGDTWCFDGTNWLQITAEVEPPRSSPALAHDSGRGRTVLFGGLRATNTLFGALADTWEWDGGNWSRVVTATDPGARYLTAIVYDSARARTIMFGGEGNSFTWLGDTWEFDGVDWRQILPRTAPSARIGHALAYDSARRRTVLFGGNVSFANAADTWEFDGANWTQILPPTVPPARSHHGLAYDSARSRTVMFGGAGAPALNDTWEYDGTNWARVTTVTAPPGRYDHALAYDVARGRTVLFGGIDYNYTHLDDTWEFDGANWTQIATAVQPVARSAHALAFDSTRGRTFVFGGYAYDYLADLWELVPAAAATWTSHGVGCAGSAGMPSLDRIGAVLPALGTSFPLRCTGLPALPGFIYFAFGSGIARWGGLPLPVDLGGLGLPGCMLWIAPEPGAALLLSHPGGSCSLALTIPANPALAGQRMAMQALVFDPASPNHIASVTNAGIATVR